MSVILTILKILGILIAVIIGIVLLAAALILFVPVRYRISGTIEEEKYLKAELHWLLHVLAFGVVYAGGEVESSLKIFGFTKKKKDKAPDFYEAPEMALTVPGQGEEDQADGNTETSECHEAKRADGMAEASECHEAKRADGMAEASECHEAKRADGMHATESSADGSVQPHTGETSDDKRPAQANHPNRRRPRGHAIAGIIDKIKTARQKFLQLIDRVIHARQKGKELWHTIVTDSNRIAVSYIGKELVYLLRHLRFRRWKTDIVFSLGDPALTGQVLGGLATLPFLYQKDVQICPDFASDISYLRGNFSTRGHLHLIHVLCSFLRLICKKECRSFIKSL